MIGVFGERWKKIGSRRRWRTMVAFCTSEKKVSRSYESTNDLEEIPRSPKGTSLRILNYSHFELFTLRTGSKSWSPVADDPTIDHRLVWETACIFASSHTRSCYKALKTLSPLIHSVSIFYGHSFLPRKMPFADNGMSVAEGNAYFGTLFCISLKCSKW